MSPYRPGVRHLLGRVGAAVVFGDADGVLPPGAHTRPVIQVNVSTVVGYAGKKNGSGRGEKWTSASPRLPHFVGAVHLHDALPVLGLGTNR
jgi:hypothetical protein